MKRNLLIVSGLALAVLLGVSACDKQPDLAQVEELQNLRQETASLQDQLGRTQEQKEAADERTEQVKKENAQLKLQIQSLLADAAQARQKVTNQRLMESDQTDSVARELDRMRRRNQELEDTLTKTRRDLVDALRARLPAPKIPASETPETSTAPATREYDRDIPDERR